MSQFILLSKAIGRSPERGNQPPSGQTIPSSNVYNSLTEDEQKTARVAAKERIDLAKQEGRPLSGAQEQVVYYEEAARLKRQIDPELSAPVRDGVKAPATFSPAPATAKALNK